MRHGLVWIAVIATALSASNARAVDALAYSFETGTAASPDGFGANGGGTYTQDTIGATLGPHSMKVALAAGDFFVGGLTGNISPAPGGASIFNPPGVTHVLFDMNIPAGGEVPAGNFAVVGVTIFGCTQGGSCGNQVQFADIEHIDGKLAGQYNNIQIDLTSSQNGPAPTGRSFNQIFGASGSGSDLIPTHFELFFNKTSGANQAPLTVYIDNVRVDQVPEPATFSLLSLGAVVVAMCGRRPR